MLASCHGLMHTVGRTYRARRGRLELADLQDYLPRSNDPGCSAGFAHGLVTGRRTLDRRPATAREAADVCADAGTRYRRYSCVHGLGHAFMRVHGDRLAPALALCTGPRPQGAPDCAQGAYHDYWFAVVGADETALPPGAGHRRAQALRRAAAAFVRPCWYRAFVDDRPGGRRRLGMHLDVLCDGLHGLQRAACITGAALIGRPTPRSSFESVRSSPTRRRGRLHPRHEDPEPTRRSTTAYVRLSAVASSSQAAVQRAIAGLG